MRIVKNRAVKAMNIIKGYCNKMIECNEGCAFFIEGKCMLQEKIPANWTDVDEKI